MDNTEKNCCICGSTIALFHVQEKLICEKCLNICHKKLASLWRDSIENLFKEYGEACKKCLSSDDPEDVHNVRVLGRKIRAVLQFIGLPQQHDLLLSMKKVHLMLSRIRETDVLLSKIDEWNQDKKDHEKMVKLLSEKREKMKRHLSEKLPLLINGSFYHKVQKFANQELLSYVASLDREKALRKYEAHFNKLVETYERIAEEKGKTSSDTIKILHEIRKKAKSLRYIYHYFHEVFNNEFPNKEPYYKNIQHEFGEIMDLTDWLNQLKTFKKMRAISKSDRKEVSQNLKMRLNLVLETVELHEIAI